MKIKEDVILRLDMSRSGIKPLKFSDLYGSIDECIHELKNTSDNIIEKKLKGYEYLLSFKKYIENGKELTEKQIVQLKRLAPEIARGYYLEEQKK